jgi:hypothetical protein
MWGPYQKAVNPAHGMPEDVMEELRQRKILNVEGLDAPKTVSLRLSHCSTLHQ